MRMYCVNLGTETLSFTDIADVIMLMYRIDASDYDYELAISRESDADDSPVGLTMAGLNADYPNL